MAAAAHTMPLTSQNDDDDDGVEIMENPPVVPKQDYEVETLEGHHPMQSYAASAHSHFTRASQGNKLHELTAEQASTLPYPIGATLWHKSKRGELMGSGIVKCVSMDVLSRTIYYTIDDCCVHEDDVLCLGAGCPVRVQAKDDNEIDGKILYGKVAADQITYAVMLSAGGDRFLVEEDVKSERVIPVAAAGCIKEGSGFVDTSSDALSEPQESSTIPSVLELENAAAAYKVSAEEASMAEQTTFTSDGSSQSKSDSSSGKKRSRAPKDISNRPVESQHSGDGRYTSKKSKDTDLLRINIPSWLLQDRESQQKLCEHLQGDDSLDECMVKGRGSEMYISAKIIGCNAVTIRSLVQRSLLRFLGDDCSDKRLIYDLAVSAGTSVLPLNGESDGSIERKVVKSSDIVKGLEVWITVVNLPFVEQDDGSLHYHGRYLENGCLLDRIRHETGCSIGVYGEPHFAGPLRKCPPYIILYGERLTEVNVAYAQIVRTIAKHQRTCTCRPVEMGL